MFNLSTPLVVYEQKGSTFNATIALVSPSGGSTIPFRIDIMETEITATHGEHNLLYLHFMIIEIFNHDFFIFY